jgi:hypothetical protein
VSLLFHPAVVCVLWSRLELTGGFDPGAGASARPRRAPDWPPGSPGWGGFGRPGGDLLFRALRRSTIGAEGFHGRVRDGIGCYAPRYGHQAVQSHARPRELASGWSSAAPGLTRGPARLPNGGKRVVGVFCGKGLPPSCMDPGLRRGIVRPTARGASRVSGFRRSGASPVAAAEQGFRR